MAAVDNETEALVPISRPAGFCSVLWNLCGHVDLRGNYHPREERRGVLCGGVPIIHRSAATRRLLHVRLATDQEIQTPTRIEGAT